MLFPTESLQYTVTRTKSGGARGKEPACQCRRCKRRGFDPWVGQISWRRKRTLQYSCLENSMDRATWRATVYRVPQRQTWVKQLSRYYHHDSSASALGVTNSWCLDLTQENLLDPNTAISLMPSFTITQWFLLRKSTLLNWITWMISQHFGVLAQPLSWYRLCFCLNIPFVALLLSS